jgi:hypothetical protein
VTLVLLLPQLQKVPSSITVYLLWRVIHCTFGVAWRLRPICDKICQYLWFDGTSLLKIYDILPQLHGPFSNPAQWVSISKNVIQWLICQDPNSVGFKIMLKLPRAHDYSITYFLHFWIVFLGASESFRNKVYWNLMQYLFPFLRCFSFQYEGPTDCHMCCGDI